MKVETPPYGNFEIMGFFQRIDAIDKVAILIYGEFISSKLKQIWVFFIK